MSRGADLIAAERERQIAEEGYTAEHDRKHGSDLAWAGMAYAGAAIYSVESDARAFVPRWWPWAPEFWKPTGDPVRDLTKAGALIAAAIDSLTEGAGI